MKSQNVKDSVFEMIDLLSGGVQTTNIDDDTPLENTLTSQEFEQAPVVDG